MDPFLLSKSHAPRFSGVLPRLIHAQDTVNLS
jgi:hypothetical protein